MVTFICENCDKTLKKAQVDRHLFQCRYPPHLVCIDCSKIFVGNDHKYHNSCISEQQKTMGQYYKPPPKKEANVIKNNENTKENVQTLQKTSAPPQKIVGNGITITENKKANEEGLNQAKTKQIKNNQNNNGSDEIKKIEQISIWKGWKNMIKQELKKNKLQMDKEKLKETLISLFLKNFEDKTRIEAEKCFNKKISLNGKVIEEGKRVRYLAREERAIKI